MPDAGWAGRKNGELIKLAEGSFDAFVTMDQNLQYQQSLEGASIAIVVLECRTNRLDDLLPLVPKLLDVLRSSLGPGEVIRVGV